MPTKKPKPEPLGEYLTQVRGNMSRRRAAKLAGVSEARMRHIENGYETVAGGINVPVHPRAVTVVKIAQAIGADADKALKLAGYDPKQFSDLTRPDSMPEQVRTEWFANLPKEEREQVLAELQRIHIDTEIQHRSAG